MMAFLAFGCVLKSAQAQNTSLGLRTGINFTSLNGFDNDKTLTGANFGAFVTQSIVSTFGVTGEINFMMKGARFEDNPANIEANAINYLEIPIYGNYFFGQSNIRPKIFAGPTLGLLMTGKAKYENNSTAGIKDQLNSTDFGALVGAGAHFKITGENWLIVDARYGFGFNDITKANASTIKNRGLSINIGVSFPLGNF